MKERPILFSAPMVRALLAGTKTQTRRIVKGEALKWLAPDMFIPQYVADPANGMSPYGYAGDRLWARETHAFSVVDPEGLGWKEDPSNWDVIYRADESQPAGGWRDVDGKVIKAPWRPSIFMPRWASRITLDITNVSIERLNDISDTDAEAEGWPGYSDESAMDSMAWYSELWDDINGPGSWEANPWVWIVEFRRLPESSRSSTP
ncbi:MAG: hypothetical protein JWQ89_3192 [Devosia sp.]|uniref:hypothetical protein n=1 Tax=Devosia sp. TaxID=1871048 RepID=UPI0026244932|nr:hypothetical protein [Devosia sp.]MDB5541465.1 hypothetical protein [Devosia sp.]